MSSATRIIAIDGPAGAGKSTAARTLAKRLGYVLLDTGALYRAVALAAQRQGVDWSDELGCADVAQRLAESDGLRLEPHPEGPPETKGTKVLLRGEDVSLAIRAPEIGMGASKVSAFPGVRDALLDLQRQLGRAGVGVVAEGRDIGTVVFPDAPVKFFLTASLEVRAKRRQAELAAKGRPMDLEAVKREVERRDEQDSTRAVAPLEQADDAVLIDSTGRDIEDVVSEMLRVVDDASS
ncbi:MAG TPA: (d)CMP kinase [Polyangiaceae bacterium]|nr:(d)CMP kinase [Polyangiaceae bacterium]